MTFVYPAVFVPSNEKEGYDVLVPDLGCNGFGESIEAAADDVRDSVSRWIEGALQAHEELPQVSALDSLEIPEGGEVRQIMVHVHLLPDSE
jgi:predicted RNase H-like HicB family nuclease